MASRTVELPQTVRRSRQLDFSKAMSDFKVMFPSFDYEVIEMVLRANNGLVDATVDQLLSMQAENNLPEDEGNLDPELNVRLPSYNDTGPSTFDPPPAYTPRVEEEPHFSYDSTFLDPHLSAFSHSVSSRNSTPASLPARKNHTTQYNPPLLGTLPSDFLRLNFDDNHDTAGRTPPQSRGEIFSNQTSNPLYESSSCERRSYRRHELRGFSEDVKPNTRPSVNGYDQGFDAIPSNEDEAKSPGKKGKSKKFGQMSRKFKRKKTKNNNGTTYQQMSGASLIDEGSGD